MFCNISSLSPKTTAPNRVQGSVVANLGKFEMGRWKQSFVRWKRPFSEVINCYLWLKDFKVSE
jgi:hypothetical protein